MIQQFGGVDGLISRRRLNVVATSALATRRWPFASEMGIPEMRNHESNALVFVRPSRHAGPDHHITVDAATLRPLSCTCQAGRHGLLCWAIIDVTATELVWRARQRWQEACGEVDIRAAAAVLTQTRKWAAAARELQALRAGADLARHFANPANYAHAAALAAYQPEPAA